MISRIRMPRIPDTPEALAARIYYRDVVEPTVKRERAARFPVITPENARELLDWQEGRIAELVNSRK